VLEVFRFAWASDDPLGSSRLAQSDHSYRGKRTSVARSENARHFHLKRVVLRRRIVPASARDLEISRLSWLQ